MKHPFIPDQGDELLKITYNHNLSAIKALELANEAILVEVKKRIAARQKIADKKDEDFYNHLKAQQGKETENGS